MVDNQHRLISGYRDLPEQDIKKINTLKDMEKTINGMIANLRIGDATQRHLSLGATHIETGFMYLIKSVAKPTQPE